MKRDLIFVALIYFAVFIASIILIFITGNGKYFIVRFFYLIPFALDIASAKLLKQGQSGMPIVSLFLFVLIIIVIPSPIILDIVLISMSETAVRLIEFVIFYIIHLILNYLYPMYVATRI